jgi:peptide/nickel transport system permease protein
MLAFVIQRLMQAAVVMLAMSVIVYLGIFAIGNPIEVLIPPNADQEIRARLIREYGLDQPFWRQYLGFLGNLLDGDFGRSFVYNTSPIALILHHLPATLELAITAVLIGTLLGIPLGMYAGYRPHAAGARIVMGVSILGFSVPTFWVGLILMMTFAVELGWLPAGGRGPTTDFLGIQLSVFSGEGWRHIALPAFNLALFKLGLLIRLARAGTREAMLSDYVKFARATGQRETTVLRRHVLKNISIPIVTVFGLELGSTIAFAVVTETIFSWPGMGKLIIDSIAALDRPVMVAYLIFIVFLFILINLTVDLVYALLDPRQRRMAAA